ncbi:MAG: phosphoribosylformylglycinamidine synthase [Eubacteriales bacterium]|nr:phosphoribosylformylglycinamidine synthase [Eubacteriales bacterium]
MSQVKRLFVEKKADFAVAAEGLKKEVASYLGLQQVTSVRILCRYDIEGIDDVIYQTAKTTVFCEPPVDDYYEETFPLSENEQFFTVTYLPGQFDQRADSAVQCIKLLAPQSDVIVRSAFVYVIGGGLTPQQLQQIRDYVMNPVDSMEDKEPKPQSLRLKLDEPADVAVMDGLIEAAPEELRRLYEGLSLAMTFADFCHIQAHFQTEKRNPTLTEIRVLDTYWSDHCRHTTFLTELTEVTVAEGKYADSIRAAWQEYLQGRVEVFGDRVDKYVSLMDIALMAMRQLKKAGKLADQEETDEINACSIIVPVDVDGCEEEWLINFKNETHNHPTEIEPFGGAATCLGGAIRDPLSGRTYVYQAMRVTGAADPTVALSDTMAGKLPQKRLVKTAAAGYSSYGNQIGLATGYVKEIYHPDYVAKRMEIGAVLGAAPRAQVRRETADPGDAIILLGGRTGRDGCGGATGSSKAHTTASIETCGAEVQKGNAPTERKLQRLFRRAEAAVLIKKCNDFGAGGVSVAIGELADGLHINLDLVPKKYDGLDGTELAISESQERMAVVIAPTDIDAFLSLAAEENLEAVHVADVTEKKHLVMTWRGKTIVDLSRAFLDTNGAHQSAKAHIELPTERSYFEDRRGAAEAVRLSELTSRMAELNSCSQRGLVEMFDSSIGAGTVLMPYSGKYQATETQAMVAKVPVEHGDTTTVTMMSYGFEPKLSSWSPFHGAMTAVLESVSKIVCAGGQHSKIRFTFQEYFKRMTAEASSWSQPLAALLGAYRAQMALGLPSIGGKDSMSGTFDRIHVPPTLVSFAVAVGRLDAVISPDAKQPGNVLVYLPLGQLADETPDFEQARRTYELFEGLNREGKIYSAYTVEDAGMLTAMTKMAFGNRLGLNLNTELSLQELLTGEPGAILAEVSEQVARTLPQHCRIVATVTAEREVRYADQVLSLTELYRAWEQPLSTVFVTDSGQSLAEAPVPEFAAKEVLICKNRIARPKVFIPVFPGTNCEYDLTRAFETAGADVAVRIFRNTQPGDIEASIEEFVRVMEQSQILMFPGGFSAGDEPDGSAKFFATAFRNERLKDSVHRLLYERDGLALGICNGFQALIKLGLVPEGRISDRQPDSPTLTHNLVGRHVSRMAYIKVVSKLSPWLSLAEQGAVYANPASHGEGRFVANPEWMKRLIAAGQIATVYTDVDGRHSNSETWNINGSIGAVEGITSPDGRVYGKMIHSERIGRGVAMNISGEQDLQLFKAGVRYFS